MNKRLEKIARKAGTIIIDASFLEPPGTNLCSVLYEANGMEQLNPQDINRGLAQIDQVKEIVHNFPTAVISEVIAESTEFQRLLNGHARFFKRIEERGYTRQSRKLKGNNPKNPNFKGHGHRREARKAWDDSSGEVLDEYGLYADKFYGLLRTLGSRDPRNSFDRDQRNNYAVLLNVARAHARTEPKAVDIRNKGHYVSRKEIGADLETDQKVVATAFTLAHTEPVLILTRDWDIKTLGAKVVDHAGNFRPKYTVAAFGLEGNKPIKLAG